VIVKSPEFNQIISQIAAVEQLGTGFGWTEGPVWHPDGYLLFSDIPESTIRQFEVGSGISDWRTPSSMSNGLTFDAGLRLVACEHATSRVTRTEFDGTIVTLASHFGDAELNSPNDIVVRSDGTIYFTDPLCGREPYYGIERGPELGFQGVFRLRPDAGELTLLADDFEEPNGLCFSPDESLLYVGDSMRMEIRVFEVAPDGRLGENRVFLSAKELCGVEPDGMKIDEFGNLFAAMPDGVWVVNPQGDHLGTIEIGERVTNLAWGGEDWSTLFVTAGHSLYRIPTRVTGARLTYMS
jgi:gluconolactonase